MFYPVVQLIASYSELLNMGRAVNDNYCDLKVTKLSLYDLWIASVMCSRGPLQIASSSACALDTSHAAGVAPTVGLRCSGTRFRRSAPVGDGPSIDRGELA